MTWLPEGASLTVEAHPSCVGPSLVLRGHGVDLAWPIGFCDDPEQTVRAWRRAWLALCAAAWTAHHEAEAEDEAIVRAAEQLRAKGPVGDADRVSLDEVLRGVERREGR